MSCGFEEVVAFFFLEEVAILSHRLPEPVACPAFGFSDQLYPSGLAALDACFGVRFQEASSPMRLIV
jgi:hypothetical protein